MARFDQVRRLRYNNAYLAAGAIPFALALGFLIAALVTGVMPLMIPVPHGILFGVLGLSWALLNNRDPVGIDGDFAIDELGVHHGGRQIAQRSALTGAFLSPASEGFRVYLREKGKVLPHIFGVPSEEVGREILRELGFDASQTATEMRAASDVMRWSIPKQLAVFLLPIVGVFLPAMLVTAAYAPARGLPLTLTLVTLLITYVFGLLLAPTKVRIGIDGVALRWFHREEFVPFARVKHVEEYKDTRGNKVYVGVRLRLVDGGEVLIPQGQEGFTRSDRRVLITRIRDARKLFAEGKGTHDRALLARQDRSVPEWIAHLRRLASGATVNHRVAPVSVDSVLRLLDDPSTPPPERVAAAIVAVSTGDPSARDKVRIAAETTALPKLRIALENALDAETEAEATQDALVALLEDEARAPSR